MSADKGLVAVGFYTLVTIFDLITSPFRFLLALAGAPYDPVNWGELIGDALNDNSDGGLI